MEAVAVIVLENDDPKIVLREQLGLLDAKIIMNHPNKNSLRLVNHHHGFRRRDVVKAVSHAFCATCNAIFCGKIALPTTDIGTIKKRAHVSFPYFFVYAATIFMAFCIVHIYSAKQGDKPNLKASEEILHIFQMLTV